MTITFVERFVVTAAQLYTALRRAGLQLSARSDLPAPDPALADDATGPLFSDGAPTPQATQLLEIVADPAQVLSMLVIDPGAPAVVGASVWSRHASGPFVQGAPTDGGWDLTVLPTSAEALVAIDEALGITNWVAEPATDDPIPLDVPSYAALLALADALQALHLETRLAHQATSDRQLTVEAAEEQFRRGVTGTDTRWAVTAARAVAPVDIGTAADRLDDGLATLAARELCRIEDGIIHLHAAVFPALESLGRLVRVAGISTAASAGEGIDVAHVDVLRASTGIWLSVWNEIDPTHGRLDVHRPGVQGALAAINELLTRPT